VEETVKGDEIEKEVVVKNKNKNEEAEVVNKMEELEQNEDLICDWLEESV